MEPPFPFLGAGEASYGEWALIEICFARAPNGSERSEIVAAAPAPLCRRRWSGRLLEVWSQRFVHREIALAYGARPVRSTRHVATSAQLSRFNSAIAAWLVVVDTICPIRLAHRRADLAAGGTKLSRWHTDSLVKLPRLWRELRQVPSKRMVRSVVAYARAAQHRMPSWVSEPAPRRAPARASKATAK